MYVPLATQVLYFMPLVKTVSRLEKAGYISYASQIPETFLFPGGGL